MQWRRPEPSRPWFVERDRRFGMGWSPATPEGWAVVVAVPVLMMVGVGLMHSSPQWGFAFLATVVLLAKGASVAGRGRR